MFTFLKLILNCHTKRLDNISSTFFSLSILSKLFYAFIFIYFFWVRYKVWYCIAYRNHNSRHKHADTTILDFHHAHTSITFSNYLILFDMRFSFICSLVTHTFRLYLFVVFCFFLLLFPFSFFYLSSYACTMSVRLKCVYMQN